MEKIDEGAALRCSLNNEEFRERQASIQRNILPEIVAAHLIDSNSIANGLKLTFHDSEVLRKELKDFIGLERKCCDFLTFTLAPDAASPEEPLCLTITGPPEAANTIEVRARAVREPR
jgi:hypothetical protein